MTYEEALKKSTDASSAAEIAQAAHFKDPNPATWKAWNDAASTSAEAFKGLLAAAAIPGDIRGDYGSCAAIPMTDVERARADAMAAEMCADSSCDVKALLLARRVLDLLEAS